MSTNNNINLTMGIIAMFIASVYTVVGEIYQPVNGELNTSDFKYSVHITDVIPYYTYSGISKVLTGGEESMEDQDVIRLIIQDTDFYAVYNNGYDSTFQFAGIYQGVE